MDQRFLCKTQIFALIAKNEAGNNADNRDQSQNDERTRGYEQGQSERKELGVAQKMLQNYGRYRKPSLPYPSLPYPSLP